MKLPPVILSIETSVGPCSVAISRGPDILAEQTIEDFHQQSKMLVPMCQNALQIAGMSYQNLDAIAATCGPGSFTSIRVGLASAKALAFAAQIPFYGVSTLEVLAFAASGEEEKPILVALDAHRNELYIQRFSCHAQALSEAIAIPAQQLREHFEDSTYLLAGNAQQQVLEQFLDSIKSMIIIPSAIMVGSLVNEKLLKSGANSFLTSPVYIRPPDAKLPSQL
jgi:tRNA threonylcarbamoyladenosine biosynthesis protein TsaB